MSDLNFDATNISPRTAFDPLPAGWYTMRITGAEMVTSETAGQMLKIEHEIDDQTHPEFAGRKVWSNLCINHPTSDKAREIARATLSGLAHAVGVLVLKSTTDLLGLSVQVKLKVKAAQGNYDAGNDVAAYKAVAATDDEPKPAPAVKPASAPARTAGWKKP